MMGGDFNGRFLELEQFLIEFPWNTKFGKTGSCFLGEVIGHFYIDIIRRYQFFPRPAFVNNIDQLVGDIDAPAIVPAIFKPLGQFIAGILIQDIHV